MLLIFWPNRWGENKNVYQNRYSVFWPLYAISLNPINGSGSEYSLGAKNKLRRKISTNRQIGISVLVYVLHKNI